MCLAVTPKACATQFCRSIAQRRDAYMPTLRLYSVYGPYEEPSRFVPSLIARGLRGELPPRISLRGVPRFRTSDPSYLWLNRLQCLNVEDVETATGIVRYDVYAT